MSDKKKNFFVKLYSNKIFLICLLIFYTILIGIFIYLLIFWYIELLEINKSLDEMGFLEAWIWWIFAMILNIVLYFILFLFLITSLRLYFISKKYKKINKSKDEEINTKEL